MTNCVREKELALADLASSVCNYVLRIQVYKSIGTVRDQLAGFGWESMRQSSKDMVTKVFSIVEGPLKTSGFDVSDLRTQI